MSSSSPPNKKIKVLLTGSVRGSFDALSTKLSTLQRSKAGPFDVCFCSGPFFGSIGGGGDGSSSGGGGGNGANVEGGGGDDEEEARRLLDGTTSMPLPVIFCDVGTLPPGVSLPPPPSATEQKAKDGDEIDLDDDAAGGDENGDDDNDDDATDKKKNDAESALPQGLIRVAPSVYRLIAPDSSSSSNNNDDGDGVPAIINLPIPVDSPLDPSSASTGTTTLVVAFLPPRVRLPCPTFADLTSHPSYVGCDLLLSSEWGQGLASPTSSALTEADKTKLQQSSTGTPLVNVGSYDVAELVAMARPRYHVAPALPPEHYYVSSNPYRNVPSSGTAGIHKEFHVSRFVALGPVLDAANAKKTGKEKKFIHAVGIVPLVQLDRTTALDGVESAVDCPYTDASYGTDRAAGEGAGAGGRSVGGGDPGMRGAGFGLSAAQARRIALEDASSGGAGGEQFRWRNRGGNRNNKRTRDGGEGRGGDGKDDPVQIEQEGNPDNKTLFLHGLHKDPTGTALTGGALLEAFRPFGCLKVRHPPPRGGPGGGGGGGGGGARPSSYAFLEFDDHDAASECLHSLKGEVVVRGIHLTLKWSSPPSQQQRGRHAPMEGGHGGYPGGGGGGMRMPPPPPHHPGRGMPYPPPGGGGIPPPPPPPRPAKRARLTEAEASESTSLFLRLPTSYPSDRYSSRMEELRSLAQSSLEDAVNEGTSDGDDDRVTAESEPALKVELRHPTSHQNYAFLGFASHAAASMAVVSLTGHPDGGSVLEEALNKIAVTTEDGDGGGGEEKDGAGAAANDGAAAGGGGGATLYWAKGAAKPPPGPQGRDGTNGGEAGNKADGLRFHRRHFPPDARTDCWFCLASPSCERHLIVSVGESCYVAMPKGPMHDYHALIVPVTHDNRGALLNPSVAAETESVKSKLRKHAREKLQMDLFVFERAIQTKGGYHTHVQCIPVASGSGSKIQSTMIGMARRNPGFELREVNSDLSLAALREDDDDEPSGGYFYAEVPLGGEECKRFLYRARGAGAKAGPTPEGSTGGVDKEGPNAGGRSGAGAPTVPLQFGREVLASVLGKPDVAHWKACVVHKEKEEDLASAYRSSFAAYE